MAFTLERLTQHFPNHDTGKLAQIIQLLRRELDPCDLPATGKWVDQCHNMPSRVELLMFAFNELLGYHGVEDVGLESESGNYRTGTISTYCNSGDTYNPTIIWDAGRGVFKLTDVGSFVEAHDSASVQD